VKRGWALQLIPGVYLLGVLGPNYAGLVASGLVTVIIRGIDMYVHSGTAARLQRMTRRLETNPVAFVATMTLSLVVLGSVAGAFAGNVLSYAARGLLFGLICGVIAFLVLEPSESPSPGQVPDSA